MAEQDIIIKIKATDEASPTVQAINDEISGVEQKLLALKKAGQESSQEFKNLTQKQEELTKMAQSFQDLPLEEKLNQTKKRMMELAAAGKTNTSEFRRLSEEAGNYKRQIEGVEQTVQMLSVNGSKGMAVLTESVTAMTAGMAIAQGAIALFGEENEDLQKRMVQVQGAMSLAMGVQQLMNTLTQRSILLTEAYAAAQRVLAWTTGASSAAMNTFRTALLATGIGALLVAVGFLYQYIAVQEEEIDVTKKAADELERYNQVMEESAQIMGIREAAFSEQVAAMKLAGKSESLIQAEMLKTANIRDIELKQVEANAKAILNGAKMKVIAEQAANQKFLQMYSERAAMYGKDESEAQGYLKTWEENGKKLKDQLIEIEGEEKKLNAAQIQRRTEILNIQLAMKAARKTEAEEAKNLEAERVAIAWEAHSQVIKANEKELGEFDKTVTEKLKKLGKGHRLYKQAEEDFAKARIQMIGRHGEEEIAARQEIDRKIAENAMAAENRKFDEQILAIGRGNADVRKKQKEIAKIEEDRLRKQIEIFRNNCIDTADLEIQLQNTIATNREAAYQDEIQEIEIQGGKREALIFSQAKDMESANAMITASTLQGLEEQRAKAIEYGQDITEIDRQIAQIRAQVTDEILKDGKRRMEAAEQNRRNMQKIGADERKILKQDYENSLKDSEKTYNEDLKLYQDLLDAKLISEEEYTATVETLKQERRDRDTAAEKTYLEGLKSASSSYYASEIQSIGQMMKAVSDFRSTEYQNQIDQAQNAKEDEILQVEIQYKRGLITAETYERQKAGITDRYDKMAEAYERKKFETDKQAAIAQALINTYLAGAQVLANTKGGPVTRFLAMAAVIGAGLAQVATIAKTQFRSTSAGQMTATASLGGSSEPSAMLTNPQTTDLSTGNLTNPGGASGAAGGGQASGNGGQGSGSDSGNGSTGQMQVRAYVVERDIEQTSQRVRQLSEFATL